jgi:hypothetical protein
VGYSATYMIPNRGSVYNKISLKLE